MLNNVGVHFIIPVWGEIYTSRLLSFCLPSLMSTNNLPGLNNQKNRLTLVTTQKDYEVITSFTVFRNLEKIIDVYWVSIEDILAEEEREGSSFRAQHRFQKMTKAHNKAIDKTRDENIAYSFIMPDNIFFDGALPAAISFLEKGKRLVYSYGLHVKEEQLTEILRSYYISSSCLTIASPEMARIAMDNLHDASRCSIIDSKPFLPNGNVFFKTTDYMILKLCFLHPILFYPSQKGRLIPLDSTFDDGSYLDDVIDADIAYIEDSRTFFMYSVDSENDKAELRKYYSAGFSLYDQALRLRNMEKRALENFKRHCVLHTAPNDIPAQCDLDLAADVTNTLFFLVNDSPYPLNLNQMRLRCIVDKDTLNVFGECMKVTELLLAQKEKEALLPERYKEIKEKLRALREEQFHGAAEELVTLEQIEKLLSYFDYGNNTDLFGIEDLVLRVNKVDTILEEQPDVAFYAAGGETRLLLRLLKNKDKVVCIYDKDKTKTGDLIEGIEVLPFSPNVKNNAIIISSTAWEDEIYRELSVFNKFEIYRLNEEVK